MISPAAAELIRRAREQIRTGVAHVQNGEPLISEVWSRAALASLHALEALLDEPAQKPLRRMALVAKPRDEEAELPIPEWMERKR